MREICMSGLMSGEGKRSVAAWPKPPRPSSTLPGLASVMIALVFLYMIASIFIFGGELNAAILRAKRKRDWTPSGAH